MSEKAFVKVHKTTVAILLVGLPAFPINFFATILEHLSFLQAFRLSNILVYILLIWFLTLYIFLLTYMEHKKAATLGLKSTNYVFDILYGFLYFTVGVLYFWVINFLLDYVGLPEYSETVMGKYPIKASEWVVWLLFVPTASFCEEIIFRGYAIGKLKALTNKIGLAVILSSISYALFLWTGFGLRGLIIIGIWGLGISILYAWRGNVITTITAHLLNNTLFYIFILHP